MDLAYFACCQPVGHFSFMCLLNGELHQISMPSLLEGKPGPWSSFQLAVLTYPLSLQQITPAPLLMSSCGYTPLLQEGWREGHTSHRKGLLTKLSNQRPCRHATGMRISGGEVCVEAQRHLELFSAACGPPETSSEPRYGRGTTWSPKFARSSCSAGRRACNQLLSPR